eukprot:g502.t1
MISEAESLPCLLYLGKIWGAGTLPFQAVQRDPRNRYYMSKATYSPETYPPYASGNAYILDRLAYAAISEAAKTGPALLEDTWVGVLASILGINAVHSAEEYVANVEITQIPRMIHSIWLQRDLVKEPPSNDLEEKYVENLALLKALNQEYTFRMYTSRDCERE